MADTSANCQGLPDGIPIGVLFGSADKTSPKISPDGKYYAYLASDANGVGNVFVKPVLLDTSNDELEVIDAEPQQVTHESHRPLWIFRWAKSLAMRRILYIQDSSGDENYHVHVISFALDETHTIRDIVHRDLTPYDKTSVMGDMIKLSPKHPDAAFIYLNKRDERFRDGHKVNLETGEMELVVENPGVVEEWLVDGDLRVVGALARLDESEVLRVPELNQNDVAQWKIIATWPHGETVILHTATMDGKGVYVSTTVSHSRDGSASDTSRLVLLSLANGSVIKEIAHDELCDVY